MSAPKDGGAAFPIYPDQDFLGLQGMSLRDWFAGQALAGLATDDQWTSTPALARHCYGIADAMLAARGEATAAPDLYAALDALLAAYAEPDRQICCNGHHCGCQGSTVQQMAEHYARAALAKARGEAK